MIKIKRFSSKEHKEEEEKDNKNKKSKSKISPSNIAIWGGILLNVGGRNYFYRNKNKSDNTKKVYENLKKDFESKGKKVLDDEDYLVDGKRNASYLRNGNIKIDKNFKGRADILAHEMGHEYHKKNKKSLGGILHSDLVGIPSKLLGTTEASLLVGLHSGYKKRKAEENGKKESKWNKYKPIIVPGLATVSTLGREATASYHGYKKLKESGADKDTLKKARKNLLAAIGSYAGVGIGNIGVSQATRSITNDVMDMYYKYKRKKKQEKEKENKNK